MSLGGILGKLIGGIGGNLLGGLMGGEKPKPMADTRPRFSGSMNATPTPKTKAKAGRLALIKTKRTGVFDEESTSGRGKLFGN